MGASATRGRFAPFVLGTGLVGLAVAAGLFGLGALVAGEDARGFALSAVIGATLGVPLRIIGRTGAEPTRREALMSVLALWLLVPVVGLFPYVVSAGMSPLDALFEAMSGFTATGATAIRDFERVPDSVFLWRAFSQWVGGIGILVLFIAVFPQLAIAGRQIFHAEMPGPSQDRLTPRLRQTAGMVLTVYLALSVVCGVGYVLAGMPMFDAVAHAFTTVAAAGFSPSARSFESYDPNVDWVALVFMTLAAVNFALLWRAFVGRPRDLWRDPELRAYVTIVAVIGALVISQVWHLYAPYDAVRHGLFQVVSIITTTGYASTDFDQWPDSARALLVFLMAIGGSAGSAAGGVKVARWLIIAQHTTREVRRALHPRAVLPIRVGNRVVSEEVLRAVAAFISLYTALIVFGTLVLSLLGEDLITAFTATAATVGNVGPGLGGVGPMSSFADLHPLGRGLMVFNMYAGRLEIVTVFVLATGGWWRWPRTLRGRRGPPPRPLTTERTG